MCAPSRPQAAAPKPVVPVKPKAVIVRDPPKPKGPATVVKPKGGPVKTPTPVRTFQRDGIYDNIRGGGGGERYAREGQTMRFGTIGLYSTGGAKLGG